MIIIGRCNISVHHTQSNRAYKIRLHQDYNQTSISKPPWATHCQSQNPPSSGLPKLRVQHQQNQSHEDGDDPTGYKTLLFHPKIDGYQEYQDGY